MKQRITLIMVAVPLCPLARVVSQVIIRIILVL